MTKYKLVNFKISPETKCQFQTICEHNNMRMSFVINAMIKDFIAKNSVEKEDRHSPLGFFYFDHHNRL
jgi:antitoxin component of RelBE/YafQ-DinJ toxin-antitoxin module